MVRIVKKAEERREEILMAAEELFLARGYDQTTMKDVMERLQIAKGTIYHYFTSKEELLEAVLDAIVTRLAVQLRAYADEAEGDALARIRYLIVKTETVEVHDQEMLENLHRPGNTGMHLRLMGKLVTMQAPIYAELIRRGVEEKLFATEHPLESAEFILAAIHFLTDHMGLYPWTGEELSRRLAALPALVEAQIRAPAGSFRFLAEIPS